MNIGQKILCGLVAVCVACGLAMPVVSAPNYVHGDGSVAYTNGGADLSSGEVVDLGNRYGIAAVDIASNNLGTVFTEGVWGLTLATNQTVTLDSKLYWSSTSTQVTTTATSGKYLGLAVQAVTTTSNTALIAVDLNACWRPTWVSLTNAYNGATNVYNVLRLE